MAGAPAKAKKKRNYKFLEMLPNIGDHAMRVRVQHHVLAREVEFRILAEGSPESTGRVFFLELRELTELDHPAFMPVLERGMIRGCHCYTVPLRFHPTVEDLVEEEETFRLEDRCQALRNIASGLCAAHLRGFVLGPMSPAYLGWDAVAGHSYFIHHQLTRSARPELARDKLPEDVGHREGTTPAADVFHWGLLAYGMLTGGQDWLEDERRIRDRVPSLDKRFAAMLEACLERKPENRPRDGAELNTVLHMDLRSIFEEHRKYKPDTGKQGEVVEIADSVSLSPEVVTESLRKLRKTGRIPTVQAVPEPDPESIRDESVPEGLATGLEAGDEEPNREEILESLADTPRDQLLGGLVEAATYEPEPDPESERVTEETPSVPPQRALPSGKLQVVSVPSRPKKPPRPIGTSAIVAAEGAREHLENAGRKPSLLEGLAVGFIVGFAAGGWAFYMGGGGSTVPQPPPTQTRPTSRPAPVPTGTTLVEPVEPGDPGELEVSELPPSTAARYLEDRFVRKLLKQGEVDQGRFEEVWKTVRFLSLRRRLPPAINDRRRVIAMRDAFEINPGEGVKRLNSFLADLKTMLGPGGD